MKKYNEADRKEKEDKARSIFGSQYFGDLFRNEKVNGLEKMGKVNKVPENNLRFKSELLTTSVRLDF